MADDDQAVAPGGPERAQLLQAAQLLDQAPEDPIAGGAPAGPPPDPVAEVAREVAGLLVVAGQMMAIRWPRVAPLYSPAACETHGAAVAPALVKLGWWTPGGDWAPYVTAAAAVVTLGLGTLEAIRAEDRTREDDPAPARPAPGAALVPVIDRTDPASLHVRA